MYSRYWFSAADKSHRTAALIGRNIDHKPMTELSKSFPRYETRNMQRFWIVNGFDSFESAFDFDVDSYMLESQYDSRELESN